VGSAGLSSEYPRKENIKSIKIKEPSASPPRFIWRWLRLVVTAVASLAPPTVNSGSGFISICINDNLLGFAMISLSKEF
jgi:hypothetical protein